MALPILTTPVYETTLPSTGKQVSYRPFTVAEEKILLVAQESKDTSQILKSIKTILEACVQGDFVSKDLTSYDIEALFLKIRAKSVGETAKVAIKCDVEGCKGSLIGEIDLENDIKIIYPERVGKVQLTPAIGVVLRDISVSDLEELSKLGSSDSTAASLAMISSSISKVFTSDHVYDIKDHSENELRNFVNSLTREQIKKIEEYLSKMPYLSGSVSLKCNCCSNSTDKEIRGLQSFFA